jgi:hypothetical protein
MAQVLIQTRHKFRSVPPQFEGFSVDWEAKKNLSDNVGLWTAVTPAEIGQARKFIFTCSNSCFSPMD